jgi:cytochrome P450
MALMTSSKPTPPGSTGLPILGETLTYLKDAFSFIEDRVQIHGPVFKTSILGRKAVVISGPQASEIFMNGKICQREGSMPPHIQILFGGKSLPLLDGQTHLNRKLLILKAFSRDAMESYLPAMQENVENYFRKWEKSGEFRFLEEAKQMSLETICINIFGLKPGEKMDTLRKYYDVVGRGFISLPVNLPYSPLNKAFRALDKILEMYEAEIKDHQENSYDDGLSRILNGTAPDGTKISVNEAKSEMHHIIVAGFIIFAELVAILKDLHKHPEIRQRLTEEIMNISPEGPVNLATIEKMTYLNQVIMEIKRLCPILPSFFSTAKEDFEFNNYSVPKGWMVLWALRSTNIDKNSYTNTMEFDPERFSPERAEHKNHPQAFVPHGPGPETGHRCPGMDYTTYLMAIFTIVLLRNYKWQFPANNFSLNWSVIPPEPTDGLKLKFQHN